MQRFCFNSILPEGWIRDEIQKDLDGFIGELDNIVPDMIQEDDIYGANRLTRKDKAKDVGAIGQDADWEIQYLWWPSETQSNWLDGLVRCAYLVGDARRIEKAKRYLYRVLDSQDEDGYIGVYAPDLRYRFDGENGELWAQSTFFRAALAYYEFTREEEILTKVKRALDVTMRAYPVENSAPFKTGSNYAGLCHGLTITDTFYEMYRYTGERRYLEYAEWLYRNYSLNEVSEPDCKRENLLNYDYRLKGHGVHTYEHIRAVLIAALASPGQYGRELDGYFSKLVFCLTPSGGPIGDEWVAGRAASATDTGYEYCSIMELMHTYAYLLEITGNLEWADKMEWLLYNAGFGARHPFKGQIAYCKTDNSYAMEGDSLEGTVGKNLRYKYSAAHQDVAVCCVPNAGRIMPYFIHQAFLQTEDGVAAALYLPCSLRFEHDGAQIEITQKTDYPFRLSVHLEVKCSKPVEFTLHLRKPQWTEKIQVRHQGGSIQEEEGQIALTKLWSGQEQVIIEFGTSVREQTDLAGDVYYSYGPLLYALPIPAREKAGRTYIEKYQDTLYSAKDTGFEGLWADTDTLKGFQVEAAGHSFSDPPLLSCRLYEKAAAEKKKVILSPIGSTILRKVTFHKQYL